MVQELAQVAFANLHFGFINDLGQFCIDCSATTEAKMAGAKRIKPKEYKDGRGEGVRAIIETEVMLGDKFLPGALGRSRQKRLCFGPF